MRRCLLLALALAACSDNATNPYDLDLSGHWEGWWDAGDRRDMALILTSADGSRGDGWIEGGEAWADLRVTDAEVSGEGLTLHAEARSCQPEAVGGEACRDSEPDSVVVQDLRYEPASAHPDHGTQPERLLYEGSDHSVRLARYE